VTNADRAASADRPLAEHVRAVVSRHLSAVESRHRGVLSRLRQESGLLVVVALVLTVASLALLLADGVQGLLVLALALLPAVPLLLLGLWLDRHEPEPAWLLFRCFVWGASVATLFAGLFNSLVNVYFGDAASQLVSAPVIEEALKGAALLWVMQRFDEHLNGRLDAVIYALFVGLGFAAVENVFYYQSALVEGGFEAVATVVLIRGVMTPFLHPAFTVLTGLGILRGLRSRGAGRFGWPLLGYLGAVLLHALWNTGLGMALYLVLCVPVFIVLARRVLAASRAEQARVNAALDTAIERGQLHAETRRLVNIGRKVGFREWLAAARDPEHAHHRQWRARRLAWLMASEESAQQVAEDDHERLADAASVQLAATELLASEALASNHLVYPPTQSERQRHPTRETTQRRL
jgi:RsiW-degrading membrane proteinase PrsW (M82 family)